MGKGKSLACKSCGHEWSVWEGIGMMGQEPEGEEAKPENLTVCPKCGSKDLEGFDFLWD